MGGNGKFSAAHCQGGRQHTLPDLGGGVAARGALVLLDVHGAATATTAQSVRLVVALTETGGTLGCKVVSIVSLAAEKIDDIQDACQRSVIGKVRDRVISLANIAVTSFCCRRELSYEAPSCYFHRLSAADLVGIAVHFVTVAAGVFRLIVVSCKSPRIRRSSSLVSCCGRPWRLTSRSHACLSSFI